MENIPSPYFYPVDWKGAKHMAKMPKYTQKEATQIIRDTGLKNKSTQELRALASPLLKAARARLKRLEDAGLTDMPAYRGYKRDSGAKISSKTADRNTLLKEVHEAYKFLEVAKTSKVSDARKYVTWLNRTIGFETTPEQRTAIFDAFHRLEKDPRMGEHFQKYGYDQVLTFASSASNNSDFDVEAAVESVIKMLEQNYDFTDEMDYDQGEETIWTSIYGGNPFYS